MLIEGKYTVFHNTEISKKLEDGSFFLLRDGDALAAMTLRSYAANALQLLDWNLDPLTGKPLTKKQKADLVERADGANALADEWALKPHKIPD